MYDIAIIGLGPAGAMFAGLLDKGFKVVAIDKKSQNKEGFFMKACGGLLATDAQKALTKLDLTLPKDVLVDPQIFAVKTIDLGQNLVRHYQRFYINLDRNKFDRWLIDMIGDNVEIIDESVCKNIVRKIDGGFAITYLSSGQEKTVFAKYVVGADGSNSMVRRDLFGNINIKRYLSIQQSFEGLELKPFYSCVFDKSITSSYCWTISKDNYFVLGGAFPVREAKNRFECLKAKVELLGYRLNKPVKTESCFVSMPQRYKDFCTADNGAFLIGEAAGFISPSSLEGISYALNSASILAKVFNSRTDKLCRAYKKKIRPVCYKLMRKKLKAQFMYRPFLRKLIMKSGMCSVKVNENLK